MRKLKYTFDKIFPWLLIICGTIGFIAAFIITDDKIRILEDPNYVPSCSLNPILSCGSVMQSDQANFFGFPNSFIGLAAFPVMAFIGVAMLAGARFKRWFWVGFNIGILLAVIFCHYLFFQSVYRINALCLYCMAVWTVTITSFVYVTLYNLRHDHLRPHPRLIGVGDFFQRHHADILVAWLLIIAGLIVHHFWYYFGKQF